MLRDGNEYYTEKYNHSGTDGVGQRKFEIEGVVLQ
jgi:hypothetical protein